MMHAASSKPLIPLLDLDKVPTIDQQQEEAKKAAGGEKDLEELI